jgi:hypothetical protein
MDWNPQWSGFYQPETDNFRIFRHDPGNKNTISHNNITVNSGRCGWKNMGRYRNGLNQWQESTGHFKRFFYSPKEDQYTV